MLEPSISDVFLLGTPLSGMQSQVVLGLGQIHMFVSQATVCTRKFSLLKFSLELFVVAGYVEPLQFLPAFHLTKKQNFRNQ